MKKRKIITPLIFILLVLWAIPVYAAPGKIHSLTLSTFAITKDSKEMYYDLMCKNKLLLKMCFLYCRTAPLSLSAQLLS